VSVSLVRPASRRPVLITSGAGFIGTNLAHRLSRGGRPVRVYDNLSRPGAEHNLRWLRAAHRSRFQVAKEPCSPHCVCVDDGIRQLHQGISVNRRPARVVGL
jgi:nucleoside-diphosphate-sugar epimerase